jgi:hypothetical protein
MVRPGVLECIRSFLEDVDLGKLRTQEPVSFPQFLNKRTKEMQRKCQVEFGVARKCLNLFFRDALYNFYPGSEYDLTRIEPFLEIPLDSFVGRALKKEDRTLPRWKTVTGITPNDSAKFQAEALRIAQRKGTHRVHLDIVYWRGGI